MGTPGPWRCKVEVASEQLVPGKPPRGTVCRRRILEEPLSVEVEAQGPWDACSHLAPTAEPVFHAGLLMPRQSCDPARHTPSSPASPWDVDIKATSNWQIPAGALGRGPGAGQQWARGSWVEEGSAVGPDSVSGQC